MRTEIRGEVAPFPDSPNRFVCCLRIRMQSIGKLSLSSTASMTATFSSGVQWEQNHIDVGAGTHGFYFMASRACSANGQYMGVTRVRTQYSHRGYLSLSHSKFMKLCLLFSTLETSAGKPGMNGFNDSGNHLDRVGLGNSPKLWNWIIRTKVRCGSLGHEGGKFNDVQIHHGLSRDSTCSLFDTGPTYSPGQFNSCPNAPIEPAATLVVRLHDT